MSRFTVRLSLVLAIVAMLIVVVGVALRLAPVQAGYNLSPDPDAAMQARDAARYATLPTQTSFIGAKIGADHNQITTEKPVLFDHAKWDTAGFWDASKPRRMTLPRDGFYDVSAMVTVLGSGYKGSPASPWWIMTVIRNGDEHDYVCSETRTNENVRNAQLASCSTTDWFVAGDYLQLSVTPDRTVESNWPGRNNVSPILSAVWRDD